MNAAVLDRLVPLPENVSTFGEVDLLFWVIFVVAATVFVATEGALLYFFVRAVRNRHGTKATFTHGNRRLEIGWTLATALVLGALAIAQQGAWRRMKMSPPSSRDDPVTVQVLAHQFQWNFRYPGTDGLFGTNDDVASGQLHVPVGRKVRLEMRSLDVLHSLFLPHLRVKQDIIPGRTIVAWFEATRTTAQRRAERIGPAEAEARRRGGEEASALIDDATGRALASHLRDLRNAANSIAGLDDRQEELREILSEVHFARSENFEIVCAELCGNLHHEMRGKIVIHARASDSPPEIDRSISSAGAAALEIVDYETWMTRENDRVEAGVVPGPIWDRWDDGFRTEPARPR